MTECAIGRESVNAVNDPHVDRLSYGIECDAEMSFYEPSAIDHTANDFHLSLADRSPNEESLAREENERLIRGSLRRERFSQTQERDLQAFGIREPDLIASLLELGTIIQRQVLPEVLRIAALPVPSQNCQP